MGHTVKYIFESQPIYHKDNKVRPVEVKKLLKITIYLENANNSLFHSKTQNMYTLVRIE